MAKCIVPGCRNIRGNKEDLPGISFHRIPKNEAKRSAWMKAIGIHKYSSISERAIVCSQHFSEDNFDRTSACGLVRLRTYAIPNIFNTGYGLERGIAVSENIINHQEFNLKEQDRLPAVTDHSTRSTSLDMSTQTSESFSMGQELLTEIYKLNRKYKSLHLKFRNMTRRNQRKQKKIANLGSHPAKSDDVDSPDWVPTQNMGYPALNEIDQGGHPVTQGKQHTMGKLHIPTNIRTPPIQVQTEQRENVSSVGLAAEKSAVLSDESGLKKHSLKSSENDRSDSIKLNNRMCRLCLKEQPDMWLFCSIITFEDQSTLDMVQVFQNLTEESTEQIENPMLPKHICKTCVVLLVNAHSFHQTYEKSNNIITEFLSEQKNENKSTYMCSKQCLDEAEVDIVEEVNDDSLQYSDENNAESGDELPEINQKVGNFNSSPEESSEEEAKPAIKLHSCPICLKKFTALNLKQHCRSHDDLKRYLNAAPRFNKKIKFYANPRTNNTCLFYKENVLHACPFCSEEFDAHKFMEHMKLHRTEGNFRCNICNRNFLATNHLKTHQLSHKQEATFNCQDCGKGFFQQKNLEFHRLTHTTPDDLPYKCEHCERAFSNPEHLRRHSFFHEKSISYEKHFQLITTHLKCKKCLQKFKTIEELNEHVCRFCCAKCRKVFAKKSEFSAHVCKFKLNPTQRRSCKKVLFCYVCGKNIGNMTQHLLTHYPHKRRIFTCAHCGKQFRAKGHLDRHVTTIHMKIEEFKCRYCAKGFKDKWNMQVHERIHVGVKSHVCHICDKSFLDKNYLKKHLKVHVRVDDLMSERLKDKYINDFWGQ